MHPSFGYHGSENLQKLVDHAPVFQILRGELALQMHPRSKAIRLALYKLQFCYEIHDETKTGPRPNYFTGMCIPATRLPNRTDFKSQIRSISQEAIGYSF